MAATLVQIKSRMLLPLEEEHADELEEEEVDPRMELVEKLLEYRRYKDVAEQLERREEFELDVFKRSVGDIEEEPGVEVDLYDLVSAFKNVVEYAAAAPVTEVLLEEFSVEEKIAEIEERMKLHGSLRWSEIFSEGRSLPELICMFLAILELIRLKRLRVQQSKSFGDIRIFVTEKLRSEDERDG